MLKMPLDVSVLKVWNKMPSELHLMNNFTNFKLLVVKVMLLSNFLHSKAHYNLAILLPYLLVVSTAEATII